mmetsp:Transcript_13295/g.42641  ORF Transcript_13295/g.42641 Transcript_13295/m.42641 type:complete len:386 (+) Transcript_13295:326-1483(+)
MYRAGRRRDARSAEARQQRQLRQRRAARRPVPGGAAAAAVLLRDHLPAGRRRSGDLQHLVHDGRRQAASERARPAQLYRDPVPPLVRRVRHRRHLHAHPAPQGAGRRGARLGHAPAPLSPRLSVLRLLLAGGRLALRLPRECHVDRPPPARRDALRGADRGRQVPPAGRAAPRGRARPGVEQRRRGARPAPRRLHAGQRGGGGALRARPGLLPVPEPRHVRPALARGARRLARAARLLRPRAPPLSPVRHRRHAGRCRHGRTQGRGSDDAAAHGAVLRALCARAGAPRGATRLRGAGRVRNHCRRAPPAWPVAVACARFGPVRALGQRRVGPDLPRLVGRQRPFGGRAVHARRAAQGVARRVGLRRAPFPRLSAAARVLRRPQHP